MSHVPLCVPCPHSVSHAPLCPMSHSVYHVPLCFPFPTLCPMSHCPQSSRYVSPQQLVCLSPTTHGMSHPARLSASPQQLWYVSSHGLSVSPHQHLIAYFTRLSSSQLRTSGVSFTELFIKSPCRSAECIQRFAKK